MRERERDQHCQETQTQNRTEGDDDVYLNKYFFVHTTTTTSSNDIFVWPSHEYNE